MDATELTQEQTAELASRVVVLQRLYGELINALDDDRTRDELWSQITEESAKLATLIPTAR